MGGKKKDTDKEQEQIKISLAEWRWINNLKQSGLAKKMGVIQSIISKVERGDIRVSIDFKSKFENAYGKEEAEKILEFVFKKK